MEWWRCVRAPHPALSVLLLLLLLLLLQRPLHLQQHPADVNALRLLHSGAGKCPRGPAAL
jgi:hypothetical protein